MAIQQLIMAVSAELNRRPLTEFGLTMEHVLESMGRFYGAHHCRIFSIRDAPPGLDKRFEWHAPEVAPRPETIEHLSPPSIHRLTERLTRDGIVYFRTATDIPVTTEEGKARLPALGSGPLLIAPLFLEQPLFGFLALEAFVSFEGVEEAEIDCLRTLAEMISNAWHRSLLIKERELFKAAVEHGGELIVITDSAGTIEYVNPAFEKITGYTSEEVIGQNPRILKSGRQNRLFYQDMWRCLTHGEPWHGFFVNRKKDGSFYNEAAVIVPIEDAAGRITNYVGVKRDTTQENKLERELIQSQKMEAIGILAGGVAHDFNNILSAILGYAELALYEIPDGNRGRDDITEVLRAANRARELVRQILTFSRKADPEFKSIDIAPMVKEVLKFLRASLPSTIEIRPDIRTDSTVVLCSPTQIQQVLMNLCTNAAHAMGESGGVLEVSLHEFRLTPEDSGYPPELRPGRYAKLTVKDNGPGIHSNNLDRIFDPYFTTKEKGEGTGLGLSVVHGIAKTLKGAVAVDSRPGDGATFHVYLPQVVETGDIPMDQPATPPTGTERILVVDDEDTLANLGRMMLERLGYTVTITSSSREALEKFRSQPDNFDLIISDKTMPHMTGLDLAGEIKKIRPDAPVIVCTGYSSEAEVKQASELGIAHLLIKPLTMDDLAHAVRVVLDNK